MWDKINGAIDELAGSLRAISTLVASALMLAVTCGIVWALYKVIKYEYALHPWWIKFLGL